MSQEQLMQEQLNDRMGIPKARTGGWGRGANADDICPRCKQVGTLRYVPGWMIVAENICPCGYVEIVVC